jgi:hypothetical protein
MMLLTLPIATELPPQRNLMTLMTLRFDSVLAWGCETR